MEIFSEAARLWGEWELRALVLTSLFIQTLLISTASIRTRTTSRKIGFLVWLCYLLADSVATLALGVLAKTLMSSSNGGLQYQTERKNNELKELWAPFLLLHLGGPDNITAFSLEDNELWLRHLLGLLVQAGTAFYIFFSSFPPELALRLITILMFMGGIIKYIERTLALMNASRDNLRSSMVTDPDPGPDYAEVMKEYSRRRNEEGQTDISFVPELYSVVRVPSIMQDMKDVGTEIQLIWKAHHFFQIFKRLIVDLVLTYEDAAVSMASLLRMSSEEAYKVIEIELWFLYEVLYTKATVVRTLKGWILRFISVSSIIAASIIFFAFIEKKQYHRIDVAITYVLLSGAIALEFWSLMTQLFTDWTFVWMKKKKWNRRRTRFVVKVLSYTVPPNRSRWSNSMAQYNLIQFCLKDQPSFWRKIMKGIHVKDLFDKHWYRTYKNISEELKKFIFEDVKLMSLTGAEHSESDAFEYLHSLRTRRGEKALKKINTDEVLDNSIKAEFDESILLWHIATDICYYLDGDEETVQSYRRISRDISNYMLYLLVSRPFMLTAGIGQIRYGDTCADAKRFFHRRETEANDEEQACKSLHKVETEVAPAKVKGDRS